MKLVQKLDKDLKDKILEFLYKDELYNVHMIGALKNHINSIKELYLDQTGDRIEGILMVIDQEFSYYADYYVTSNMEFSKIASKLSLKYDKPLVLAGKEDDNKVITREVPHFTHNQSLYMLRKAATANGMNKEFTIRPASTNSEDIAFLKYCVGDFYSIKDEKTIMKLVGRFIDETYILETSGLKIGTVRVTADTKNYAELSMVYIIKSLRGMGYGKTLLEEFINIEEIKNKNLVLQTSCINMDRNLYSKLGFDVTSNYLYSIID